MASCTVCGKDNAVCADYIRLDNQQLLARACEPCRIAMTSLIAPLNVGYTWCVSSSRADCDRFERAVLSAASALRESRGLKLAPVFGSPDRCCECDAYPAVQAHGTMHPGHFCDVCGKQAISALEDARRATGGLQAVADMINEARRRNGRAPYPGMIDVSGHGYDLTVSKGKPVTFEDAWSVREQEQAVALLTSWVFAPGGTSRWPFRGSSKKAAFVGSTKHYDVWAWTEEVLDEKNRKPIGEFSLQSETYFHLRPFHNVRELLALAGATIKGEGEVAIGSACDLFIDKVGRAKLEARARAEQEHEAAEKGSCAGCGKPSQDWLDMAETVRVCHECAELVPSVQQLGRLASSEEAARYARRLADPYGRHELWECRRAVYRGAAYASDQMTREEREKNDAVWLRTYVAERRLETDLLIEQLAAENAKRRALPSDAQIRANRERDCRPDGLDMFDPRGRRARRM